MIASARKLFIVLFAVAAGWLIANPSHAAVPAGEAPTNAVLPPIPEPTASQEAATEGEAEFGPKNIIHLLPPPILDQAASKSGDDRHVYVYVQPGKPRSSHDPDLANETAAFSDTAARPTTPQDLVRERAAQRDLERRRRIEGRRWIGYDPSRPVVSAIPFMSGTNWQPLVIEVPDYRRN